MYIHYTCTYIRWTDKHIQPVYKLYMYISECSTLLYVYFYTTCVNLHVHVSGHTEELLPYVLMIVHHGHISLLVWSHTCTCNIYLPSCTCLAILTT